MFILGIETTCDETSAAVVERLVDGRGRILSNIVLSQITEHAAFGGVVPEIAAPMFRRLIPSFPRRCANRNVSFARLMASPPPPGRALLAV
jgi:N6-L-threonylcarbamoyladenine synthase